MGLSLKPDHLKRYAEIGRLLVRYGRGDLVAASGLDQSLGAEEARETDAPAPAAELAGDLERLGPIFIKVGQALSTRPDLLPAPYIEALSRLQDNLEPFSFGEVEAIVEEELG